METVSKQITETKKEVINKREIFYQYAFEEGKPESLKSVNFSTTDAQGKQISGSYSNGQFNINGQANTDAEFELLPIILKSVISLIESRINEMLIP